MHRFIALCFFLAVADAGDVKIVGGQPAAIEDHPWQVSILITGKNSKALCGGSLIEKNYVITVAHCAFEESANSYEVRAGSIYYDKGGELRKVKKVIKHENYNPEKTKYDIALLQLSSDYKLSASINLIPIATSLPPPKTDVLTSGFGTTKSEGSLADKLQEVIVAMVEQDECKKVYENHLSDKMFCAAAPGKDSCQGDSGGPVSFNGQLIGLTSFGYGCAYEGYPGVYTSVPSYVDWIKEKMEKKSNLIIDIVNKILPKIG